MRAQSGCWVTRGGGRFIYIGPDHCTKAGAERLAKRLKDYWRARGVAREFEVFYTGVQAGEPIFGVREAKSIPFVPAKVIKPEGYFAVGPTPRAKLIAIIRDTLRQFPSVSFDQLMNRGGATLGKRPYVECAARRACMEAVSTARPDLSTTQIGALFNVDHTTVMYSLSRDFREQKDANKRAWYLRNKQPEQRAAA